MRERERPMESEERDEDRKTVEEEEGREKCHRSGKRTEAWRQQSVVLMKDSTTFISLIL